MIDEDDDGRLAAYVDGHLAAAEARSLEARLAGDAALRERLRAMREGGAGVAAGLAALLAQAPTARLEGGLEAMLRDHPPRFARSRLAPLARLAAGVAAAAVLLAMGYGLGKLSGPASPEAPSAEVALAPGGDWRQAVTEYAALYTADTFAGAPAAADAARLAQLGAKVGVAFAADKLAPAPYRYAGAQSLAYDGKPLAQIVLIDAAGLPFLFCVIANGEPAAPMRAARRGEFATASWSRGGRGYIVASRAADERVAALAGQLQEAF